MKTAVFDFDGTITLENTYPEMSDPNPEVVANMRYCLDNGVEVVVHSCRLSDDMNTPQEIEENKILLESYLKGNEIPYTRICEDSKPAAVFYCDDKAVLPNDSQRIKQLVDEASAEMDKENYDAVPGGLADGIPDFVFDSMELARGIEVELEHTTDINVAKDIAKDHLLEDRNYYKKLEVVESGEFFDQEALRKAGSDGTLYSGFSAEHIITGADKFTRLYKEAQKVIDEDPKWEGYQDDPKKASDLGAIQQLLVDARSEADIQNVWEAYNPTVSYEELERRAESDNEEKEPEGIEASADSWGCLMAYYPEKLSEKIRGWVKENVPEDSLYEDEDGYGYENEVHTTLAYGIDPSNTEDVLEETVKNCGVSSPKVSLGSVDKFYGKDSGNPYDVLKIKVNGDDLHKLHAFISDALGLPGNTHPEYSPHLTLAYVKPGCCEDLVGEKPFDFEDTLSDFVYSYPPEKGAEDRKVSFSGEKL